MTHTLSLIGSFLMFALAQVAAQPAFLNSVSSKSRFVLDKEDRDLAKPDFIYLELSHPEGWYSYYFNNSVEKSIRPEINFDSVEGVEFGPISYPIPKQKLSFEIPNYIYEGTHYFRIPITYSNTIDLSKPLTITASATWQICKESCLTENADYTFILNQPSPEQLADIPHTTFPSPTNELTSIKAVNPEYIQLAISGEYSAVHFYDITGQIALDREQTTLIKNGQTFLNLPSDQGNYLREKPHKRLSYLKGILTTDGKSYEINLPLNAPSPTPPTLPENSAHKSETPPTDYSHLYDASSAIQYETLKKSAPTTFWIAVGGAFLGGILLNLMPCVFPVLSLKVLSFVEKAGEDPWKVRLHGMLFTLGVMLSMWALAITLFVIKSRTGESVNWGQQMGDPRFVAGIVIILFLFGLNMAGIFELGTKLTSLGGTQKAKNDYLQTIFSGVLTTAIATPCSGPFLGAAMGYTLEQQLPVALLIFTIFALGISFPYFFLSFFPALTSKLPRPGAWMETLKKVLAFGMFAAAAFFMKTFGAQTGSDGLSLLIMALVFIGLSAYFYGHWTPPYVKKRTRYTLGFGLSLIIFTTGLWMSWDAASNYKQTDKSITSTSVVKWQKWQPGLVEHLRSEGQYVWVDYTASWCATCLVNKKRMFSNERFTDMLDPEKITFVKVDMTEINSVLAKDLSRVSRVQIPVNLVYSPSQDQPAILLEELIPPSDAIKALTRVGYQP